MLRGIIARVGNGVVLAVFGAALLALGAALPPLSGPSEPARSKPRSASVVESASLIAFLESPASLEQKRHRIRNLKGRDAVRPLRAALIHLRQADPSPDRLALMEELTEKLRWLSASTPRRLRRGLI